MISNDYTEFENFVLENQNPWGWNWVELSLNPNISLKFIKDNPNLNWYSKSLSKNPNITLDFVLETPGYDWCWNNIS